MLKVQCVIALDYSDRLAAHACVPDHALTNGLCARGRTFIIIVNAALSFPLDLRAGLVKKDAKGAPKL